MNTSLKHLSPGQQRSLQRVISIIVRAIQPEKIILFGVHGRTDAGMSSAGISSQGLPPVLGAYDLLVIGREGDRRSDYELQDLIENRCREAAPVTVLVHDISYVNRRLGEGQYFFYSVIREGVLLFDTGKTPFVSVKPPDWEKVRSLAERDFERWAQQAGAFYRSAEFNYTRSEDRAAIFLLHQTAEQIYQASRMAW